MIKHIILDWHGVLDLVSPISLRNYCFKTALKLLLRGKYKVALQIIGLSLNLLGPQIKDYMKNKISPSYFWSVIASQCGVELSRELQQKLMQIQINHKLVEILKEYQSSYDFFILSDCSKDKAHKIKSHLPQLEFKNIIFSCDYNTSKREGKLFDVLIKETQVDPKECLFIDDSLVNIGIAMQKGFSTLLYRPNLAYNKYLKSKLQHGNR